MYQREFNKDTGEFDCVYRESGVIIRREPLPERENDPNRK